MGRRELSGGTAEMPSAGRNRGLAQAAGEYASFLDHDDLWTSDKLEAQHRALQENLKGAVAYCLVNCIDETRRFLHPGRRTVAGGDVYARLLLTDLLDTASNPLIRRQTVEQVGGLDESFASAEDWDLFLRLAKYPFVCVPRVQILYREYPDSLSFDVGRMEEGALAVCDGAFASAPAPLQHLKRASVGNLYKYLAIRALQGHPGCQRGLKASRFLWHAVRCDPALLLTLAFAYTGCLAAATSLLPRWVQALHSRWERLSSANALRKYIRGDPRRSSGLSAIGQAHCNAVIVTAPASNPSLIQREMEGRQKGIKGKAMDRASGKR